MGKTGTRILNQWLDAQSVTVKKDEVSEMDVLGTKEPANVKRSIVVPNVRTSLATKLDQDGPVSSQTKSADAKEDFVSKISDGIVQKADGKWASQ